LDIVNNSLCEFANEVGDPLENVILNTYLIEHSEEKNIENQEKISYNDMYIYPNPANDKIKIIYNISNDGFVKVSIFNILGEKIIDVVNDLKLKGNYTSEFNISSFPPGVYNCKMILDNKKSIVKRIIISR